MDRRVVEPRSPVPYAVRMNCSEGPCSRTPSGGDGYAKKGDKRKNSRRSGDGGTFLPRPAAPALLPLLPLLLSRFETCRQPRRRGGREVEGAKERVRWQHHPRP